MRSLRQLGLLLEAPGGTSDAQLDRLAVGIGPGQSAVDLLVLDLAGHRVDEVLEPFLLGDDESFDRDPGADRYSDCDPSDDDIARGHVEECSTESAPGALTPDLSRGEREARTCSPGEDR